MNTFPKKQKFLKPAINEKLSKGLYQEIKAQYNAQFYEYSDKLDAKGKPIRKLKKQGAKRLVLKHKTTYEALLFIMNDRLKKENNRDISNATRNYYTNPFEFDVNVWDIINVITPGIEYKDEKSHGAIKTALYRFRDMQGEGVEPIILSMEYKRSNHRYRMILNPKFIRFSETASTNINACKSNKNKSKNTNYSVYTSLNLKSLIKNNINHSDFNLRNDLQANQNFKNLNLKKNKRVEQVGVGDGVPKATIDSIISQKKFRKIPDNRTISEKRQENAKISAEILSETKTSAEKLDNFLNPVKKTAKFVKDKTEQQLIEFLNFKKNAILNFYIFMLTVLFDDKAEKYNPKNTQSEYFAYTLQAINELVNNKLYFGNCHTKQDIEKQAEMLKNVVRSAKERMNNYRDFSTKHLYPNQYITGSHANMNLLKAMDIYHRKLHQNPNRKVKNNKKINKNSFISALIFIENNINKSIKSGKEIIAKNNFKNFIKVTYNKQNNRFECKAIKQDYATFGYMQQLISEIKTKYNYSQKTA